MKIDFEENREELEIGDMFQAIDGNTYFIVYNHLIGEHPINVISMDGYLVDDDFKNIKELVSYYGKGITKIIKNKNILITDNKVK